MELPDYSLLDSNTRIKTEAFVTELHTLLERYQIHAFASFFSPTHLTEGAMLIAGIQSGCEKCMALAVASGLMRLPEERRKEFKIALELLQRGVVRMAGTEEVPCEEDADLSSMN